MKSALFLVLLELWAGMCLSNETAGASEVEMEQSITLNLWPFNDTDTQSLHNTVPDPSGEDFVPESSMVNFTEKNTNFGFNLYRKIAQKHDNNVFFSPLSLSFALAAFLLASEGETHQQMIQSLNLHLLDDKEIRLPSLFQQLSTSLAKNKEFTLLQDSFSFIQKGFQIKDTFRNLSKRYFDMEFLTVDFQNSTHAKNTINQHVKQKTRGKIPSLFDVVDHQARLILVNCILFKGNWLHPFPPKYTELDTFYIDNYRTVQVPMMSKTERVAVTFDKSLSCVVLKLPYKGSAHMLIVIPEKDADYISIEDHLTNELVESWLRTMNSRKIDIYFPKFKLDQKYHMDQLLQDLGIKNLFSDEADLSHLTNEREVKVSQVLQRAAIEVDEWGTEAVAATGSEIMAYSLPPVIRVNRPFLFMIYETNLNALLFLGRVINPTEL